MDVLHAETGYLCYSHLRSIGTVSAPPPRICCGPGRRCSSCVLLEFYRLPISSCVEVEVNDDIQKKRDYHTQQHSTDIFALARDVKNRNDAMTHPEYNPMSDPSGTRTAGRTPHPQFRVLNTWSGIFRGFCATRVLHVSSQEQCCPGG